MTFNIAIDGPAGAGKSTIAKMVAKELNFLYVDTGAVYRAMGLYMVENNVAESDIDQMSAICTGADITIAYEEGVQQVYLNNENVTRQVRGEAVGNMASITAGVPAVRAHLLELQRNISKKCNVIMDGRDIGTNVLKEAQLKIYLTAHSKTRAQRRFLELQERGISCEVNKVEADIKERDFRDMNRDIAPLKQAEDAVLIDSSNLMIEEVVQEIVKQYQEKVNTI